MVSVWRLFLAQYQFQPPLSLKVRVDPECSLVFIRIHVRTNSHSLEFGASVVFELHLILFLD